MYILKSTKKYENTLCLLEKIINQIQIRMMSTLCKIWTLKMIKMNNKEKNLYYQEL